MLKLLLLGVLAAIIWLAWKKSLSSSAPRAPAPRREERMVACAHCGVHLPEGEAIAAGEKHFCSAAHRDAGPAAR